MAVAGVLALLALIPPTYSLASTASPIVVTVYECRDIDAGNLTSSLAASRISSDGLSGSSYGRVESKGLPFAGKFIFETDAGVFWHDIIIRVTGDKWMALQKDKPAGYHLYVYTTVRGYDVDILAGGGYVLVLDSQAYVGVDVFGFCFK